MKPSFSPAFALQFAVPAVAVPYLSILLRGLGYGPAWVGILLGVSSAAGIAGPFAFGYWADRSGSYRRALILSSALPALVALPLALFVHPALSIAFVALQSVGMRSAMSLLDSVTTIHAANYGRIRFWGSVGFIAVSMLLQMTPILRPDTAVNIAVWIAVASAASVLPLVLLPKPMLATHSGPRIAAESRETGIPLLSLHVVCGMAMVFAVSFSMSAIYGFFPLYLTEILEWNVVGLMFSIGTLSELPFLFVSTLLVRRFGALPLMAVSAAGTAIRLLILAFLPFGPFVLVSQMFHALSFGTFHPAMVFFIAGIFPPHRRGVGMSLFVALGTGLPALIGNAAGGAILEAAGVEASAFRLLFAVYAAVSGLGVLAFAAMRLRRSGNRRLK